MCRWLAYRGEPCFLDHYLLAPENSLVDQSLNAREAKTTTNGDGFGVGWYGARSVPGVYRDVRPAWNDPNLKSLVHQIRSPLFLAHVRASTGTATSVANSHPFAHGRWLFMHNGVIGEYSKVRRKLENQLPDALYDAKEGETDSEVMFLLALANGLEEEGPHKAMARTIRIVEDAMAEAGCSKPLQITCALSDGESLFALRHSSGTKPPSLYWRQMNSAGCAVVVSEPFDDVREAWETVPPDGTLHLSDQAHLGSL